MDKYSLKKSAVFFVAALAISALWGGFVYAARPKTMHAKVDNQTVEIYTAEKTVGEALKEYGFTDLLDAKSTVDFEEPIVDQMSVEVKTKKRITLIAGGRKQELSTYVDTVEELLTEQLLTYDEDDVISPVRVAHIQSGDVVTLDYYDTSFSVKEEPVSYTTKTEETDDLYIDEKETYQAGKEGLREIETKTVTKNGEVVSSEVVRDEIVKAPVEEIILQGTKEYSSSGYVQTGAEAQAKEWIAYQESGGSYTAYNPGGYYGRYQLNLSLISYGASPAEQEAAADSYVYGRYGSWVNAQSFWMANGWY